MKILKNKWEDILITYLVLFREEKFKNKRILLTLLYIMKEDLFMSDSSLLIFFIKIFLRQIDYK